MKRKIAVFFLMTALLIGFGYSKMFEKGGKYLTPQIGLNSYAIPIGVSFGIGVTENIEAGASVLYLSWSDEYYKYAVVMPSVEAFYHFKVNVKGLDPFAGLNLGYFYFTGDLGSYTSGLFLSPFIGSRYYFSPKTAAMLKLYFSAGTLSGAGFVGGVTFQI